MSSRARSYGKNRPKNLAGRGRGLLWDARLGSRPGAAQTEACLQDGSHTCPAQHAAAPRGTDACAACSAPSAPLPDPRTRVACHWSLAKWQLPPSAREQSENTASSLGSCCEGAGQGKLAVTLEEPKSWRKAGSDLRASAVHSYLPGNCCVHGTAFLMQKNSITWRCDLISVTYSLGNQTALRERKQKSSPLVTPK